MVLHPHLHPLLTHHSPRHRNDILRSKGIIPEKSPSPTPLIEEALTQARALAHENRLEDKDLDELDELEDDEDEAFLDQYRQKRMAEMASLQQASVYNQVYPIQKPDYAKDVTEASKEAWVFVLLTSSSGENTESRLMSGIWRELATKFGDVKFCSMRADLCIEGYPDRNTPTVLGYNQGEIRRQIVTCKELKGNATNMEDMEQVLLQVGAINHGDSRLKKRDDEDEDAEREGKTIRQGVRKAAVDDDDSDWD